MFNHSPWCEATKRAGGDCDCGYRNFINRNEYQARVKVSEPIEVQPIPNSANNKADRLNDKLVVYKDKSGEYRWRRTALNEKIIAVSGEGYRNWQDCFDMAQSLFPESAIIVDISGTVYRDE